MLSFLADNSLFTLALILAVGLGLGKIRILGISLGAAMVLFVALGLSTANPDIQVPPLLYQFGLAMFVYAIGLSAGPAFFREFRTRGWKVTVLGLVVLVLLTALGWVLVTAFGLDPVTGAGMFAGALSSTPGMAAVVETVDPAQSQLPVVGYSLAYPGAVIGTIIVAAVGSAVLKVDHAQAARDAGMVTAPLVWRGVVVGPGIHGRIGDLPSIIGQSVIATRIADDPDHHLLADPTALLSEGMKLVINGTEEAVEAAIAKLGRPYDAKIEDSELVYTHFTVSSADVAGRRIRELDTVGNGFLIARLRSGDSEVVPGPHTVLNYSDRVRVIASPSRLPKIRTFFGDSERALVDVDLLPFAPGLAIGLIPIPLPGDAVLTLSFGGGPIVTGLVRGALNRTGSFTWQLPFHANRTMQTLGLAVFLAGVGTSAGAGFRGALTDPSSVLYIGLGMVLTVASALIIGLLACRVLSMSWDEAMGVAADMATNPAVISYLNGQTGTELPNRGYATVYPTAMIGQILAAQILLLLLV